MAAHGKKKTAHDLLALSITSPNWAKSLGKDRASSNQPASTAVIMLHPRPAAAQGMPPKKFFLVDILLLRCDNTMEPSSPPPAETLPVSLLSAGSRQENRDLLALWWCQVRRRLDGLCACQMPSQQSLDPLAFYREHSSRFGLPKRQDGLLPSTWHRSSARAQR
ncbi:hypothetical protein BKA81DRAFT_30788 [Phyllosticta paracitricarpa]